MWSAVATIAGAVISSIIGIVNASHRSPIGRRIRYHASLLKLTEGNDAAQASITTLMAAEAEELRLREEKRLMPEFNVMGIAVALTVTGIGGVVFYYALQWSLSTTAQPWHWVTVIVGVIAGDGLLIIAFASFSAMWTERKPRTAVLC